jgi:hypothetical protein
MRAGFELILADLAGRDIAWRDGRRLTQFSSSVLQQRDQITEVFNQYIPLNAQGDHLAAEPIAPRGEPMAKRYKGSTTQEWSASVTTFDLAYLRRAGSSLWVPNS